MVSCFEQRGNKSCSRRIANLILKSSQLHVETGPLSSETIVSSRFKHISERAAIAHIQALHVDEHIWVFAMSELSEADTATHIPDTLMKISVMNETSPIMRSRCLQKRSW